MYAASFFSSFASIRAVARGGFDCRFRVAIEFLLRNEYFSPGYTAGSSLRQIAKLSAPPASKPRVGEGFAGVNKFMRKSEALSAGPDFAPARMGLFGIVS
jgi:hypothetical protein